MSDIKALLEGGPSHLPRERRVQRVPEITEVIKLPFGAGYEHFRYEGEHARLENEDAAVFRWIMRTAIAE